MIVYDYIGRRGAAAVKSNPGETVRGVIRTWRDGLPGGQRGLLDEKLDRLRDVRDLSLLPGLVAGPIKVKGRPYPHIYKLQIGGKVRLRPLFCRGPFDMDIELTLLVPATERDWNFEPLNAPKQATDRREEILNNAEHRAPYVFPDPAEG